MSGHTPGPWQSRDDYTTEGFVTIIANIDGEILDGSPFYTYDTVAICEDEYGERLPNVAANVRLIAAAPALLEALQEALSAIVTLEEGALGFVGTVTNEATGEGFLYPLRDELINQIEAAIAAATDAGP